MLVFYYFICIFFKIVKLLFPHLSQKETKIEMVCVTVTGEK
jgi:hypothetical protein